MRSAVYNCELAWFTPLSDVTLIFFSALRIGFSEDDYEGLEDNPNSPCEVTAVVTDTILEIPIQVLLTPTPLSATGKKCNTIQLVKISNEYLLQCSILTTLSRPAVKKKLRSNIFFVIFVDFVCSTKNSTP